MNAIPTVDDLMTLARDGGWDFIDALTAKFGGDPRRRKQLEGELVALQEAAARLIASPDGQRVFGELVKRTLHRPVFLTQPGMSNDDVVRQGAFREGENFIVMQVIRWAAKGRPDSPITIGEVKDESVSSGRSGRRRRK